MACNWRCLCPGQPVPLSTTLPWWKLAQSVCLSHACSLSSDVIASCRQAMACNWRCLCPGQPVPLSTIFFGRDLRIQHVDIVKGSLDEKLPSYEVLKMLKEWMPRENRCLKRIDA